MNNDAFLKQSPEASVNAMDAERTLARILAKLEPERRMALVLREIEGLSYEEISEVTLAPLGTVRYRISRARDDLKKLASEMEE